MAVTSIWAVHHSVKDVLNYAANPDKTENPNADDLRQLMDYAENPTKTEQRYLVSGVNCLPELAYERMTETKRRFGSISKRCVLYCGDDCDLENGILYRNAETYLKNL